MCLSRLLDDVIKKTKCRNGVMIKIEMDHTHLKERSASLPGKKVVPLRGVVPFEIAKWKIKGTL